MTFSFQTTFPKEMEKELVKYILELETMMFGLTTNDVRLLAYQLAVRNGLPNSFNKQKEKAGKDWLQAFMKRNPELSLRQPEATSAARAMSFNPANVKKFFDLYDAAMDKYHFAPHRIFNCDETGITTVQGRPSKILAKTGRRQVGGLVSAERGQLVTTEICMNVTGTFIPPLFIFPRVRMKIELMNGAPPGSIYACHKSGWMQLDIFVQWFHHFLQATGASKENPVLLILDGHATHTKNLDVIDLARENGVVLLCLPPHCSHKLQPLDVSFMKPLMTYYDQELEKWLRNHPGRVVTTFQIAELFGNAYNRAATAQTALNGFRKTGIYPVNRHIFQPHEFAASLTTDQEEPATEPAVPAASNIEQATPGGDVTQPAVPNEVATFPGVPIGDSIQPALPDAVATHPLVASNGDNGDAIGPTVPFEDAIRPAVPDGNATQPAVVDRGATQSAGLDGDAIEPALHNEDTTKTAVPDSDSSGKTNPDGGASETAVPGEDASETLVSDRVASENVVPDRDLSELAVPDGDASETAIPDGDVIQPAEPYTNGTQTGNPLPEPQPSTSTYISPYVISPPPKETAATRRSKRPNARRGFTAILTSSPYKSGLEEIKKAKAEKQKAAELKKAQRKEKSQQKKQNQKNQNKKRTKRKAKSPANNSEVQAKRPNQTNNDEDAQCLYCGEMWSNTKQDSMIQCTRCQEWAHNKCAGIGEDEDDFNCDLCT